MDNVHKENEYIECPLFFNSIFRPDREKKKGVWGPRFIWIFEKYVSPPPLSTAISESHCICTLEELGLLSQGKNTDREYRAEENILT